MKKRKLYLYFGISLLTAFVAWTALVTALDVKPIGPRGSSVGLATLNGFFHNLIGKNIVLYTVTDWLGLVPIATALSFAVFGLFQWIKRKNFFAVDCSLFVLGGFYIAVIAVYILFELVVINYRPVLISGYLESSYPSSTTMLVMCVMPTASKEICSRTKNARARYAVVALIYSFVAFMILGRVISGVHWISDIIGGALFSSGAVLLCSYFKDKK